MKTNVWKLWASHAHNTSSCWKEYKTEWERERRGFSRNEMFMWARVDSRVCFFFFFLFPWCSYMKFTRKKNLSFLQCENSSFFLILIWPFWEINKIPGKFSYFIAIYLIFKNISFHFLKNFLSQKITHVICTMQCQPSDFSSPFVAISISRCIFLIEKVEKSFWKMKSSQRNFCTLRKINFVKKKNVKTPSSIWAN